MKVFGAESWVLCVLYNKYGELAYVKTLLRFDLYCVKNSAHL